MHMNVHIAKTPVPHLKEMPSSSRILPSEKKSTSTYLSIRCYYESTSEVTFLK